MRRLLVLSALAASMCFLTGGSCQPPPGPGEGEGEVGANDCTAGTTAMPRPEAVASRTDGVEINRGCIDNPELLATSAAITLEGCVEIFGLGGRAKTGIQVSVFDATQNPKTDAPTHGVVSIAVKADATGHDCEGVDANIPECRVLGCDKEGFYRIENVPAHVPMILKVSKPGDDTIIDTYTYGIVFDHGDAPAVDGIVFYEANLIYRSTYDSIPTLAGRIVDGQQTIGDGLGRAVIAGEIHDCDDKIVQGASVVTDQEDATTKITYFNGDDDDPEPQLSRLSTNTDGLYVVLNATTDAGTNVHTVSAGILDPACAGTTDCQCLNLSSRQVMTFPDSVTIVTLRGDLPILN